ncbi:lantibiotic protection ABC transporter ATP-binding protein [Staphylococcus haemolyticus]|uniref:lantibiotic protection ABC transporter ATP-binding protein n=1 Tax=Staphylococcus haemolyticus TaxID=1283 RepID=UPI0034D656DB
MTYYKIETRNLNKQFKKETILKDINLKVYPNEVYGLLGINGAGKSTLMKIICGILPQTSGDIYLDGSPLTRKELTNIGSLIESPPTYNHLSAQDNLKVVALNENIDFNEISKVLELVNLNVDPKKKVKNFSLGMKQRLGIAMALIKKPKLLVLDEPSNGLDPYGIQELRELLKSLTNLNTSVIISSHILSEIQQLADHVGIIHNGKLEYQEENKTDENLEEVFFNITKGGK